MWMKYWGCCICLAPTVQQSISKKFNHTGKKTIKQNTSCFCPSFPMLPAKFYCVSFPHQVPCHRAVAAWGASVTVLPLACSCAEPCMLQRRGPTFSTYCWQRKGTAVDVDVDVSVHPQLRSVWSNSFNRFTSLNGVSDRILLARSIAADAL